MLEKVIQSMEYGQIIAGDRPELLKMVCLDCCPRNGAENADKTPYCVICADLMRDVKRCPKRYKSPSETAANGEKWGGSHE